VISLWMQNTRCKHPITPQISPEENKALRVTHASPSAKCIRGRHKNNRGSVPRVQHSRKSFRGYLSWERGLPRVPKIVHFSECRPSTRGRFDTVGIVRFFLKEPLPRVQHSGKKFFFCYKILFPECCTRGRNSIFLILFPECPIPSTRGRVFPFF
jgi:hypothetical protein